MNSTPRDLDRLLANVEAGLLDLTDDSDDALDALALLDDEGFDVEDPALLDVEVIVASRKAAQA